MCQSDETRFWKKNGSWNLGKVSAFRAAKSWNRPDIDFNYFHHLSIKMTQSVFKNVCEMKSLEELLQFGTETTLPEHLSWNGNSNFSQYWWYCRIVPISLASSALITSQSWIDPRKCYYCLLLISISGFRSLRNPIRTEMVIIRPSRSYLSFNGFYFVTFETI